ncbi:MAG TPA: CoA transferase, partial [Alphaproteobacteria bacterium]|nr:CoA transferase [Alphaproteobacteria bacterium]
AAPMGGMTLAQLGADVIRFDDIAGALDGERWPVTKDGASLYWTSLNKGKRSFAVDVRNPKGRELLQAIITAPGPDAGMFITNLPVRGWNSYEALTEKRKDLIMVTLTGTREGQAQVDYTVNAGMGFPMVTGPEGFDGPVNNVLPAWDIAAALSFSTGLLAAERRRYRTGQGSWLKLSLYDVALAVTAALGYVAEVEINGDERPRLGNHIFGTFGQSFRCADGPYVMICMFTGRHVQAVRELVGNDAVDAIETAESVNLMDEADRYRARKSLERVIGEWVGARPYGEAASALDKSGALWGPYRSFAEMAEANRSNPMFSTVDQPGVGSYSVPGSPFNIADLQRLEPKPAPLLGQHTDEILAEVLGMDSGAIGRLHDEKVVAGPK